MQPTEPQPYNAYLRPPGWPEALFGKELTPLCFTDLLAVEELCFPAGQLPTVSNGPV